MLRTEYMLAWLIQVSTKRDLIVERQQIKAEIVNHHRSSLGAVRSNYWQAKIDFTRAHSSSSVAMLLRCCLTSTVNIYGHVGTAS